MSQKLLCTEKGLDALASILKRDVASRQIRVAGKPMFEVIPSVEQKLDDAKIAVLKSLGIMVVED